MTELTLLRHLPATPELVWRAFTEPAALVSWFWPERFGTTVATSPAAGGRYLIAGSGAGIAVSGEYLAVEAPRHLEFSWRWDGDEQQTLVTLDLAPAPPGTDLTLVHARFGWPARP